MRIVSSAGTSRRTPAPAVHRPRGRDRRPTLGTLLGGLLTEPGPPPSAELLVTRVADSLRAWCPLKTLRVDHGVTGRMSGAVVGLSALTIPFPLRTGAHGSLTAVFDAGYRPDDWIRQWLEGISAVVALCVRADESRPLVSSVHSASHHSGTHQRLIGRSAAMAVVWDRITRYAAVDDSVLIVGASGTGKELVAREIHDRSPRARRRFLPVNCGALVSTLLETELFGVEPGTATGVRGHGGAFEEARGGTLFFDEVTELSPKGQVSLLRVLQERVVTPVGGHRTVPVDVRIIAATNQPLDPLVADGRFREDLVYRLRVLPLRVPPLRERGADVVELAQVFLEDDPRHWPWDLRPAAAEALRACDWPGNVRQLQSVMQLVRALASSPVVDLPLVEQALADLGASVPAPSERSLTAKEMAAHHALEVLQSCGGNKTRAAARLGISLPTLRARLRHLDVPRIAHTGRRAA
jgi:transcriptional regulator with PAS, ATPase and Fis domain